MSSYEFGVAKVSSNYWSLGGRMSAQMVHVVGFVILSYAIAPEDFGILAAAIIFTGFAQVFTDLGIGPAVVAQQRVTSQYLSTAFWLNAASGVVLLGCVALVAFPLASWLGYPDLVWVIPVTGLSLALSVSAVSIAILERQFRFRTLAVLEMVAAAAGQACAVALSFLGHGLLGLALVQPVAAAVLTIGGLRAAGWRPSMRFSRSDYHELRRYVTPLILANSMNYWARSFDDLLVSKAFGPSALAFYGRAYQLMLAPVMQATLALGRVYQAAFSSDARAARRLEVRYRFAEAEVALFGLAVSGVMVLNSQDLVAAVFGPAWAPMGELLTIFALSIGPQVVTSANGAILRATGQTRLLLRVSAINSVLLMCAVAAAALISVRAVAWAVVAHSLVAVPLTLVPVCRRLGFSGRLLAIELLRATTFPAVLVIGCTMARGVPTSGPWADLAVQAVVIVLMTPVAIVALKNRHQRFSDQLRSAGSPAPR